jgi:hypothetical protein
MTTHTPEGVPTRPAGLQGAPNERHIEMNTIEPKAFSPWSGWQQGYHVKQQQCCRWKQRSATGYDHIEYIIETINGRTQAGILQGPASTVSELLERTH